MSGTTRLRRTNRRIPLGAAIRDSAEGGRKIFGLHHVVVALVFPLLAIASFSSVNAQTPSRTQTAATTSSRTEQAPSSETGTDTSNCANAFATSLARFAKIQVPKLTQALQTARSRTSGIPSNWMFANTQRLQNRYRRLSTDGQLQPIILRGRICTKVVTDRRNRPRCRKWQRATPERIAALTRKVAPPDPRPDRRERRDMRTLRASLRAQGALVAFRSGGRFYFLSDRLISELTSYLRQRPTPRMCSGVRTMTGFYRKQLGPIQTRMGAFLPIRQRIGRRISTARLQIAKQSTQIGLETNANQAENTPPMQVPPKSTKSPRAAPTDGANFRRHLTFFVQSAGADPSRLPTGTKSDWELLKAARALIDSIATAPENAASSGLRAAAIRGLRALEMDRALKEWLDRYGQFTTIVEKTLVGIEKREESGCRC